MATTTVEARRNWGWLALLGVVSIIGGILALINPFAATLTAAMLAAWTFLIFGILSIIQTFRAEGRGAMFLWNLLIGLLMVALGISLIFRPLEGIISLTVLVAIMFIVLGVAKFLYAFGLRPAQGWGWVLLSGLVSLLLGIMILADMPWAAASILGILLAVELLSNGFFMLLVALGLRNLTRARV
jgi:uncharacterized membrane protein HdeD (DUF308 family)